MSGRAQLAPTMQGAQKLRSEAYLHVRCNDEVEAQPRSERDRWTFYETIKIDYAQEEGSRWNYRGNVLRS